MQNPTTTLIGMAEQSRYALLESLLVSSGIQREDIWVTMEALMPPADLKLVQVVSAHLSDLITVHAPDMPAWSPPLDLNRVTPVLASITKLDHKKVPKDWHTFHARKKEVHPLYGAKFSTAPMYSTLVNEHMSEAGFHAWGRMMYLAWGASVSLLHENCDAAEVAELLNAGIDISADSRIFMRTVARHWGSIRVGNQAMRYLTAPATHAVLEQIANSLGGQSRERDVLAIREVDVAKYWNGSEAFNRHHNNFIRLARDYGAGQDDRSSRNRKGWIGGGGLPIQGHVNFALRAQLIEDGRSMRIRARSKDEQVEGPVILGSLDTDSLRSDRRDVLVHEYGYAGGVIVHFPRVASARLFSDDKENNDETGVRAAARNRYAAMAEYRALARSNQAFWWAWSELTGAELNEIQQFLARARKDLGAAHDKLVVLLASILTLGRPVRVLMGCLITHSKNPPADCPVEYILDQKLWRIRIEPPAYSINEGDEPTTKAVHEPADRILLHDHFGIYRFIAPLAKAPPAKNASERQNHYEPVSLISDDVKELRLLEEEFRHSAPAQFRTGLDRLARPLRTQLFLQQRDAAFASLLCDDNSLHGQTLRHYNTLPIDVLKGAYNKAALEVLGPASRPPQDVSIQAMSDEDDDPYREMTGSRLLPKDTYLKGLVSDLKDKIRDARTNDSPNRDFKFANLQSLYLTLWMSVCMALRGTVDPWPDQLNIEQQFALVNDKERHEGYSVRMTYVPPALGQQMQRFAEHRRYMASRYHENNLDHWPKLPLFEVTTHRILPIVRTMGSARFEQMLDLPFPQKSLRRYTRSYLCEQGLPGEWVDAYMGHWQNGMEPHGPYASMSPASVLRTLKPALDSLMESLGFAPMVRGLH